MDKPRLTKAHQSPMVMGPPRPARSALRAALACASAPLQSTSTVADKLLASASARVLATVAWPPIMTLGPQEVRPARPIETRAQRPSLLAVQRALASDKGSVPCTALSVSLITGATCGLTVAGTTTAVVEAVSANVRA